jgi:hypothetical protein
MFVTLLDPYRPPGGLLVPRVQIIGPGQVIDRAALAECRQAHPGRETIRVGQPAGCADHLQDAVGAYHQVFP